MQAQVESRQISKAALEWHRMSPAAVLRALRADAATGLSAAEADRRLAEHGPNGLTGSGIKSPWLILWEQLTSSMVAILIIAAILSAILGDLKDALAIGAIVMLNAALGFSQEFRAEKAMAALKQLSVPFVRLRRDGVVKTLPALQLVPGDIVLLETGNFVPADCRVLESAELRTGEAALTGESEPAAKSAGMVTQPDAPLGDRHSMVYLGTFVAAGRGEAVVTDTGMRTELGQIADLVQTVDRAATPLQRRLNRLSNTLAYVALSLVAVIFVLGLFRGDELKLLFLTAVSIGVAAVPEGLLAVVTISLTLGAQRLLRRRVLIRKLAAVETLGSVTVICTDKTGTLTQNRMTAVALQLSGARMELEPGPADAEETVLTPQQAGFALLLGGGALCNDTFFQAVPNQVEPVEPSGDPTEMALAIAAARFGLNRIELEQFLPRAGEIPFSSERKRMTTVHRVLPNRGALPINLEFAGKLPYLAITKGAVDVLLDRCGSVWIDGTAEALHQDGRDRLAAFHQELASKGMRVLGVAMRRLNYFVGADGQAIEQDLTFIGMVGIADPPRPEVAQAVAMCKAAGIRAVMITGDHAATARHIARQAGIGGDGTVLNGSDLDALSAEGLDRLAPSVAIHARVTPAHKLRIVESLQRSGQIVAMTGDGINDAPALKRADIGVAMGVTGTDVAKEAADTVLLDDNFATIVAAVEEGRVIFDNIRKFIKYILTTNSAEIWIMLAAPLLGMPLPLLPLQILWMNLVTDGLPALALGLEPSEPGTMQRPPYRPDESVFSRGLGRHVLIVSILMAALSLGPAYWYWRNSDPNWQTFLFTSMTMSQMAHVLAIRSERESLFRIGLLSNKPLLGAVSLTVALQIALLYAPPLQAIFKTNPLPLPQLALTIALSAVVVTAVEAEKMLGRGSLIRLEQGTGNGE